MRSVTGEQKCARPIYGKGVILREAAEQKKEDEREVGCGEKDPDGKTVVWGKRGGRGGRGELKKNKKESESKTEQEKRKYRTSQQRGRHERVKERNK